MKLRSVLWLVLISFIIPFCVFFALGTVEYAFNTFFTTVLRIINLFLISCVLNLTTTSFELSKGLSKLLSFLKIKVDRIEQIINITLMFIPVVMKEAKKIFSKDKIMYKKKHIFQLKKLLHGLVHDASLAYKRTRKIVGY